MHQRYRQHLVEGEQAGIRYQLASTRRNVFGRVGLYEGVHVGSSLEFKEHRLYEPGDDLRHVDWNAFARSDQLTVKQFHEEVSPHLDLVIDGSRSMDLPGSEKTRACLGLAAMLATAGENAGFSHRAWFCRDECKPVENGTSRASLWQGIDFDFGGDSGDAFSRRPPEWSSRSVRFLISDLLWKQDPLHILAICSRGATLVVVVQLLAKSDADPRGLGHVRLVDHESGEARELRLHDASLRRYHESLARHQQNWHLACRRVGARMLTVIAEDLVADWRPDVLVNAEILTIT